MKKGLGGSAASCGIRYYSLSILLGVVLLCVFWHPLISAAKDADIRQDTSDVQEKDTEKEETGENAAAKLLLDIKVDFKGKMNALSKEEKMFECLKADMSEEDVKAYLCSLDVEECYQYTIFIQHQFLGMMQKDLVNVGKGKAGSEQKATVDFALKHMQDSGDALKAKLDIVSLDDRAKQKLETDLYEMVYADACKDITYHLDSEEKKVTDLASLREYFITLIGAEVGSIYEEMCCYRGVDGDVAEKERLLKEHIDFLYGFAGSDTAANGETEEKKEADKENEKKKETIDSTEAGEGVLEQVISRTADASAGVSNKKNRDRSKSGSKSKRSVSGEEKFYEVYAKTENSAADSMEIAVSTEEGRETYRAVKGEFKVGGSEYNWQLRVPYEELLLEGTDGKITADIRALDANLNVVGRAQPFAAAASGVYDIHKRWIGSDFAKLNTNKNADQVYYVHGTVYSDDCNAQNITNSTNGTGKYSHLSVSSLDGSRATVRVRSSGKAITGTWLMIYGRIELNNLNIIGCGGKDRTVGLVSAKSSKQTSASTRQSYLSAENCAFSVANKWAVHGDRNSYLDVNNCTISQTKGGVGGHGEINVRNTTLNNANSSYSGWAGIHLNVPVSQGGFQHSIHLENDQIDGYMTGLEFAVSDFFSDQPVGDSLTSMSLTITGLGNTVTNCTTGILTSKQNVKIPLILDVKGTMSDISNCTTGILVGYANDTVAISGGDIRAGEVGVKNSGTFSMDGGNIYNNTTGIVNTGTAAMTDGSIYSNSNAGNGGGIWTSKIFHINGGRIYNNTSACGGGIFNDTGAKTTITEGTVTQNTAQYGGGVFNQPKSRLSVTGGNVAVNIGTEAGGGIYNENTAVTQITGGDISGNIGPLGAGIYQNGTLNLKGDACVNSNNDVYLPVDKFVTVTGVLSASQGVALLTPAEYTLGRICARASYNGAKGSTIYQKFILKDKPPYLFRPGDYQSGSGTAPTDVVISQSYTISYNKNYDADVSNVPPNHTKYWCESAVVASQSPSLGAITFKGWSENPNAQSASFGPGDSISAAVNRNLTLYAVWEAKLKVTYVGCHAEGGTEKSDYVTKQECDQTQGYQVKKNSEYTKFSRSGYTFAGWANSKVINEAKDVNYPERKENRISFEELRQIAIAQAENSPKPELSEVMLYDVWDAVPEIKANNVSEFYEGTDVTKEMLLANVKALDKEDGDLTKDIRITQVRYSDGKLIDGIKTDGTTQSWDKDMPQDYKLDTWFYGMDKDDSPVTHQITYAISDTFGNTTECEWTVKVKYNEFPVIQTEDRYFTLEEAQQGMISEELLLQEALNSQKLKVTDQEDDELYPGSITQHIKLLDFKSDEFKQFNESGYVVLTYSVKDSMGPAGEGKETMCQFTVHVVKDGEVAAPEPAKRVRFINKEYYELNADASDSTLTDADKEALNTNGGLNVDSKWYREKEYKDFIHSLWEDSKPDETWVFSHKDVEKVKNYINEHGIGNSVQSDGLKGFANEFGSLRTVR